MGKELDLNVETGPCKVTVQNMFPRFSSTAYIHIEDKAENYVTFRDTKWFLNFMMAVNKYSIDIPQESSADACNRQKNQ